jgi:hypothetical protein
VEEKTMALPRLNFQVTIPASGVTPIVAGLPGNTGALSGPQNTPGGFTPWAVGDIQVQYLLLQNNSAHAIRYGGPSVSVTTPAAVNGGTAGNGVLLLSSGTGLATLGIELTTNLLEWYVSGTPGDVVDILYIP